MTGLMRRTLGETIEIGVVTGDDLWRCKADAGQLENAILNLALNARDAMPQGGRLIIETANVKLDDAGVAARNDVAPGDYLMISVSDTGMGMSSEVADHAIEPFFTTKDVGEGSGLGLSQVYGFISQSDGYVTIDSEQGVGTNVKLYLPRSEDQYDPARQNAVTEDPVSQGEKILVVEDDPDVRNVTVTMLADLGYVTVEAVDGKEAIEALKQTPGIDLLLTDVVLPGGMSGLDIAREAPRFVPDIKILFTSGYAEHVLAGHGEINADVQLINKPFRRDDVARKLRAALDDAAV
jgi:CheY-like chemotaxis protein